MPKILKLIFLLALSIIFAYLFETALAEEAPSSDEVSYKKIEPAKNNKTYSDILWEYRWYMWGAAFVIFPSLLLVAYLYSTGKFQLLLRPLSPINVVMPYITKQTINNLLLRPDVHSDPQISSKMPAVLSPDSNFRHRGALLYHAYLMPLDTPYPEVSQDSWSQEAQNHLGKIGFKTQTETFMYTQVAVIPIDTATYTVYHKIDTVSVMADPGNKSIPVIKASLLFRDNAFAWAH